MSEGQRVAFLIVGVQKGGTTALYDYLRDVPALQLSPVKEPHFFDDDRTIDWAAPDYNSYHRRFDPDGRPWGEATPIYCYWPGAAERIRAYNPAMRVIMIMRDPVERAWSHWKMEYSRGIESQPFAWCIREGRARMNQAQPFPGFHRNFSYVERGFHGAQLDHLLTLFPVDQILPLRSADLSADPDTVIARTCRFLGVDPPQAPVVPLRSKVSRDMAYPSALTDADVAYLQHLYRDDQQRLSTILRRWTPTDDFS